VTNEWRSLRLLVRSSLPLHGRRPVRGDPGPTAVRCGALRRYLMARLKPCP